MHYTLLIGFIFLCQFLSAQQKEAKNWIDTLASEKYYGRGYVMDADYKTAQFIKRKLQEFNVETFPNKDYFQPFEIAVNTFPDSIFISHRNDTFEIAKDYLIEASSGSNKGIFQCTSIKKKILLNQKKFFKLIGKNKLKNKILVVDKDLLIKAEEKELYHNTLMLIKQFEGFNLAGILEVSNNKLTWSVSSKKTSIPIIQAIKDSLPDTLDSLSINIKNKFLPAYFTQNVIGWIPGTLYPDSFLVLSAHYDHLGILGPEATFNGANDNASGTAMLLALAKHYSKLKNRLPYSILVVAFSAEELGLLGSKHFVQRPIIPLKNIKQMLNFDLLGTGEDGFAIVNGKNYPKDMELIKLINQEKYNLPKIKVRPNSPNSDHYFFAKKGIQAFFFYTMGGIQAYHDIYDKPETLPLTRFNDMFHLTIDYLEKKYGNLVP